MLTSQGSIISLSEKDKHPSSTSRISISNGVSTRDIGDLDVQAYSNETDAQQNLKERYILKLSCILDISLVRSSHKYLRTTYKHFSFNQYVIGCWKELEEYQNRSW